MKKIMLILAMLLLSASAYAQSQFYFGGLGVELNKETFLPGEELTVTITVSNAESFPLANVYLIVDLVQGDDYYYPSQISDADNIFYEEKIEEINLAPAGKAVKEFKFTLPSDIKAGNYRVDAYAKTAKTSISGVPHIFASPITKKFTVRSGENKEFPYASIVRTKTKFHQFLGPVGPGISPGEEIENEVFVKNNSSKTLNNLSLFVGLCEWDDTACESYESTANKTISQLNAGEEKSVSVSLKAADLPDAYAIRLELRDKDGQLLSFYRNRSVVYGGTAKIHKLNVSDYLFKANDPLELSVLLGPSPDHYTWPEFTDFTLKVWVEDIASGKTVVEDSKAIALIKSSQLIEEKFSFTAPQALSLFKVCSTIEKAGVEHEHYCYVVDASKFPPRKDASEIEAEWNYDAGNALLSLTFLNKNPEILGMDAYFLLMDVHRGELVAEGKLLGNSPMLEEITTQPSNFLLTVNNFGLGKQHKFNISLDPSLIAGSGESCQALRGQLCTSGQVCSEPIKELTGGTCCKVQCESAIGTGPRQLELPSIFDILFFTLAGLVVIVILFNVYKRLNPKQGLRVVK